jgi:N-methylhydantoinase A
MGGTSSDFAVISDAKIPYSSETRIGDLPVIFPCVTSYRWWRAAVRSRVLDNLGVLKVWPESAGSDPGPVCYGRGGTAPTQPTLILRPVFSDAIIFWAGG